MMKNNGLIPMFKKIRSFLVTCIGLILFIAGLLLLNSLSHPEGLLLVLPYLCIGLGCGAFGHGLGDIVSRWAIRNQPQLQKQLEIDKKDERTVAISNQAKAKAYDAMIYIFGALMVSFALMGVSIAAVLLLVAAYLFVVGFFIFYLNKYNKEM